jgi:predicted XRE-type DNA-binding protein
MSNKQFTSVWNAIEDTPEEAENMKLRSDLMIALKQYITHAGLSQSQVAKRFCVTQPRVSDLMCGKINLFSLDALVNMVTAAGMYVEMRVHPGDFSVNPPPYQIASQNPGRSGL